MHKFLSTLMFLVASTMAVGQTPEENRFEKVVLSEGLNEPLELAVLPDERVIVIERHGLMNLYDPKTKMMSTIAKTRICGRSFDWSN